MTAKKQSEVLESVESGETSAVDDMIAQPFRKAEESVP